MFKVGDKVRRLNHDHGRTTVGVIYTIETMSGKDTITSFKEFESLGQFTYNVNNFELVVPEQPINPPVKSEAEIVKEWFAKLDWLDKNTPISVSEHLEVYPGNNENYLVDRDSVDFVINSYNAYKAKEDEKKKQELLDKKAQLEVELEKINKELGGK